MKALATIVAIILAAGMAAMAANEIQTANTLTVNKGYLAVSKAVESRSDMAGSTYEQKVSTFDTNTANTLAISMGAPGVMFLRNVSTNCNAIVTGSFSLRPGESIMGRLLTNIVAVYSNTNGVPGYPYTTTEITGGSTNVYTNWPASVVDVESIILAQ